MSDDHYRTLGLQPNASKSDIKKAYFRLAQSYHPDHHAKADAAGRAAAAVWFRRAKDAYEVLSDDRRRADYDRTIRSSSSSTYRQHGPYGGGNSSRSSSSGGGTSSSTESGGSEWIFERARTRGHNDGGAYSRSSGNNGNWQQGRQYGGGASSDTHSDPVLWIWERTRIRGHGDGASSCRTRGYAHGGTSSSTTSGGKSGSRPTSTASGGGFGSRTLPQVPRPMAALFMCCAGVLGGSALLWSMRNNKRSTTKQQESY